MIDNKIGRLIAELRKKKGLTQKQLADKLNISDKAVSRWETGNSSPNLDMIFRISKFFNISFNDLLTTRVTDSADDALVEEIISEFTEMNKKNSKRIRVVLIVTLIIILILTIAIIFTNTYNRFRVYNIYLDSNDFLYTTGTYVETNVKDSFTLGNIGLKDYKLKSTDIVSVDIYYLDNDEKKVIQNFSKLENINFNNLESYIKIDDLSKYMDNLYISVTVIHENNKVDEFSSKLNFALDFSNNKIYDKSEGLNDIKEIYIDNDKIESILLKNGFEKVNEDMLIKITKNFNIIYKISTSRLSYNFDNNKMNYKYVYYLKNGILDVTIYNENNIEIEKYKYDSINKKIVECVVGSCNSYKEAMNTLNKNILNLLLKE